MQKFSFFFLLILLSSCGEDKQVVAKQVDTPPVEFLNFTHPQHLGEFDFKAVCFPIWFNDLWIDSMNISSIEMRKYSVSQEEIEQGIAFEEEIPSKSFQFHFKNGAIKKFIQNEYYDERLIGTYNFDYRGIPDSIGFNHPNFYFKPFKKDKFKGNFSDFVISLEASRKFILIDKEEYTKGFFRFRNNENFKKDRFIFITDTSLHAIYSVDKKFTPTVEDIFVYGTPMYPEEQYSIKNLVRNSKYKTHEYYTNHTVKNSNYVDGNFIKKRTYNYATNGLFKGFTDSIFADSIYMNSEFTSVLYDTLNIPYQILVDDKIEGGVKKRKAIYLLKVNRD